MTTHLRRVERRWAKDEADFINTINTEDANDELTIGPVGLSKRQTRE